MTAVVELTKYHTHTKITPVTYASTTVTYAAVSCVKTEHVFQVNNQRWHGYDTRDNLEQHLWAVIQGNTEL